MAVGEAVAHLLYRMDVQALGNVASDNSNGFSNSARSPRLVATHKGIPWQGDMSQRVWVQIPCQKRILFERNPH